MRDRARHHDYMSVICLYKESVLQVAGCRASSTSGRQYNLFTSVNTLMLEISTITCDCSWGGELIGMSFTLN